MDISSHDFTISDADFHRLVQFIQQNYGIDLSKKRQLISSRLSHSLRELGYKDFRTFLEHLFSTRDPADLELVLNKLTTNYTFFLREQDHFAYFQDKILPELSAKHQRDQVLSIWSAGCSSGEEPYTLSICLKEFLAPGPPSGIPGCWPLTSLSRPCPRPWPASTSHPLTCPTPGSSDISSGRGQGGSTVSPSPSGTT